MDISANIEVFPCNCEARVCEYKQRWLEAGAPKFIPLNVALGKIYLPGVSEWLATTYCKGKGNL